MGSFDQRSRNRPNRRRRCLSKCAVVIVALALTSFAERADCQKVDDLDAVWNIIGRQVTAWNTGSVERYMQWYLNSDSTMFTSDGEVTRGYKRVLERYKREYSDPQKMGRLELSDLNLEKLSPTVVLATGSWKLVRKQDIPSGRFTLVFEKKTEGWRITHDHTSSAK
jgi:ketosteroid isomerase-like protein